MHIFVTRRHIAITLVGGGVVTHFPCPGRYFVIIGPNDSKLGMHASGNDLKCSAQEP